MLERKETVEGQSRDLFAGRVDAENATRLLGACVLGAAGLGVMLGTSVAAMGDTTAGIGVVLVGKNGHAFLQTGDGYPDRGRGRHRGTSTTA
jgi:hypothetical protein